MKLVQDRFLICNVLLVFIGTSTAFLINDADSLSSLCFPQDQFCSCIHYPAGGNYADSLEVTCFDQNLTTLPDFSKISNQLLLHYTYWYINLTDNALSTIPNRIFSSFTPANTNYTEIELSFDRNRISKIEDSAFLGIDNMRMRLILTDNRISAIPVALQNVLDLQWLSLQGNPIMTFDPTIVHAIAKSLWLLEIDYKALVSGLSELSELDLTAMTINDLTSDYKSQLVSPFQFFRNSMEDMIIFRTELDTLPCSLIDGHSMTYFFIKNSTNINAERIVDCQPGIRLKVVDFEISYCDLIEFPNILDFTPSLLALNLKYNKISRINEKFIPLHNTVEVLNLSNNQLESIPAVFSRFGHLKFLYIEQNKIAFVAQEANVHSLLSLCASGNPWTQSEISCNDTFSGVNVYIDSNTVITNGP